MKCALVKINQNLPSKASITLQNTVDKNDPLRFAKGPFSTILNVPASSETNCVSQFALALSWASQNDCEWLYVCGDSFEIHPDAFVNFVHKTEDAKVVFGLHTRRDEKGEPYIEFPQIIDPQQSAAMLLHGASLVTEPCFFIHVVSGMSITPPRFANNPCLLVHALWQQLPCEKIHFPLAIGSERNGYTQDQFQQLIQEKFIEEGYYFGEPRVKQYQNDMFEKAWRFYQNNKTYSMTESTVTNFMMGIPYFGQCPYETPNGRIFGMTTWGDDIVATKLLWNGAYEPMTTKLWEVLCATRTGIIFDIGAYTGFFALLAATINFGNTVVGFEPIPENYARCLINKQSNNLGNVTFVDLALGDRDTIIEMQISAGEGFLSTGAQVSEISDRKIRVAHPARLTQIDTFFKNSLPTGKLTVMKCDTEGFEPQTFAGGKQIIARDKPDIIIEITIESSEMRETAQWLKSLGYKFFVINDRDMTIEPVDELVIYEGHHKLNRYLSVHPIDLSLI